MAEPARPPPAAAIVPPSPPPTPTPPSSTTLSPSLSPHLPPTTTTATTTTAEAASAAAAAYPAQPPPSPHLLAAPSPLDDHRHIQDLGRPRSVATTHSHKSAASSSATSTFKAHHAGATALDDPLIGRHDRCPAGGIHLSQSEFTCCGICFAVACFPIGILCCFVMQKKRCAKCGGKV
ncbi:hypothetical protein DFJ73DRAFT_767894 [Zopfochytrium polystomum]|nr:hypothetical protein DFJ73DRAFT_767894 [Zopfochytrium polystomum]